MIAVIGAGAWGTALAQAMASDGTPVLLWAREAQVADAINRTRENPLFLPGQRLGHGIRATADLAELAREARHVPWLLVVPAQHMRRLMAGMESTAAAVLLLCAKGIEAGTGKLMTEVAAEMAPGVPLAVLSGPSFAADVAAGLPTAVTLAAPSLAEARDLAKRLARPGLRPYASDDMVGAEVGGAIKNVLAIACGVVVGAGLGDSARAALVARGFAEMTRFAVARGGRAETLAGLSGLGDLVLTCGSLQSRNMTLGAALGRGVPAAEALAGRLSVAEGASTAPVLVREAERLGVDMPICSAVAALLEGRMTATQAAEHLLARPLRADER
ncbi:NAD(P)H-dependent glycerol-3-phosphate dehydrogenase [Thermaurantiacus sp.]